MEEITIEREQDTALGCNLCREDSNVHRVTFRLLGGAGTIIRLCEGHLQGLKKSIQQSI